MLLIKTYFLGGQRTSFLFKISLSMSVSVSPLFILTDTHFDTFHWLLQKTIFFTVTQCSQSVLCIVQGRPKNDQKFTTKNQQGKLCNMRSYNFKIVLINVSQLKHIPLTKHMHYCMHNIYRVYYTTQWIFIIFS